jgi:predicted  nucleic acid-binding Zn-ribbon protein
VADSLARETQKLYGRPLSEFTAARNARAKELKQDDPGLATAVSALPKPSIAAAALNELVREDPSEVRALIQSGKRLRQAQEAAVSGKKGADLNAAVQEHRAALDRVQRDLRRRKLSGPTLEKAMKTVRVTSVDPELQPLLERGILHEDINASGFGLDPGLVLAPPQQSKPAAKPATKPKPAAKPRPKPDPKLHAKLKAAEAELVDAEKRAEQALRELERARKDVERARQAVDEAE